MYRRMNVKRTLRCSRPILVFPLVLLGVSCVTSEEPSDVSGPEPPNDLAVVAVTETPEVFEGSSVTFEATPSGGTQPYLFRWDQNDGPTEVTLTEVREPSLATGELTTPGRYVFRVIVTDANGFDATDFAVVEVAPAIQAAVPPLAIVGQPTQLSATAETGQEAVFRWEVVSGSAEFDDPTSPTPVLTTSAAETVDIRLTVSLAGTGETPAATTREFEIVSIVDERPRVRIETDFGDMVIELEAERAPLHTANFLLHVDDGFYDGLLFHRNACRDDPATGDCRPFVLQGGGYERINGELQLREPTRDPVLSEAGNGLSNGVAYSIALALGGGDPDSGSTQFFVNLDAENAFLDDQDFTVFAMVVEGTDVVDILVALPTEESPLLPGESSLPVEDIVMRRVERQ